MASGLDVMAALSLAALPGSTSVQVSAAQLFDIAEAASAKGDDMMAVRAYEALIGDPSQEVRLEARFRLAMLERKRGNFAQAASLLRRILDQRPDASRVRLELAGLLSSMGDAEGAWRQIRAVQAGGLPPAVARLVDRYSEALRAQRPFGGSFQVALAPDSNINHATNSDKLATVLGDFQIGDESRAKSGTGVAVQGQAYRRFPLLSDGRKLLVRLSGFGNFYKKSRFNDVALDLGAGPELQIGNARLNLEVGATQRWYGQKPYSRSVRLGLSVAKPMGRTSQLRFAGAASLVDNRLNALEDGKNYSGEISFEHAFSAITGIALSASGLREALMDPAYSTTSWRVGLLGWREIGRVTLTAGGHIGWLRADDRLALLPAKRVERYARLSLAASFRRLSFQGFAPVARFVIERNKSTIAFYDYRRRRVELGFERTF